MATFNAPHRDSNCSPSVLSAWERLLLDVDVPEGGCASLVERGTQKGNAIRSWILANYATKYVPEHILEALRLRRQLMLKWNRDDRKRAFSIVTDEARF